MKYTGAERAAACIGIVFAAALLLVSVDVATGGWLSYRWTTADEPSEEGAEP